MPESVSPNSLNESQEEPVALGSKPSADCGTSPRSGFWRGMGYLYLLRFSLLLWLSLVAFVVLDRLNVLTTATRGILTIESVQGLRWAGFFVMLTGWIALLGARITCAYGEERFNMEPPHWMKVGNDMTWRTFLGAQVPGLPMLGYLWYLSVHDGKMKSGVPAALLVGLLGALLLWALLTIFSYWAYEPDSKIDSPGEETTRPKVTESELPDSKAFFAPVVSLKLLKRLENADPPALARGFTDLFQWLGRHAEPGFQKDPSDPKSPLNAGHAIALILFCYLAFLYYVFFFYTAPVPLAGIRSWLLVPVCAGLLIWFVAAFRYFKLVFREGAWRIAKYLVGVAVVLSPVWLLVTYTILLAINQKPNIHFPVIASIYILLFSLCSGLSGLAFVLDRFRIPVLTTVIALLALIHVVIGTPCLQQSWVGEAQHIVQTHDRSPVSLMYPKDVLARFHATHPPGMPIVIVTATGGGMHAASWTAQLLGNLENLFKGLPGDPNVIKWRQRSDVKKWYADSKAKDVSFHNSILLVSTVSGGSVGASEWIQAYARAGADASFEGFATRAGRITECSSLEAVAWGLIYPDIFHVLIPFRINDDIEKMDRSWALQRAIERNESVECLFPEKSEQKNPSEKPVATPIYGGTLADYALALSSGPAWVPAFSLNSTVAETGDRFLFANYRLPQPSVASSELLPASSFLNEFCGDHGGGAGQMADLPLSAAARLSASFPYVSSMARLPRNVANTPYHFGDGGYFDNDGTGTAIEFLSQAYLANADEKTQLQPCEHKTDDHTPSPSLLNQNLPIKPPSDQTSTAHDASPSSDNILLIEIRDGGDPQSDNPPDSGKNQDAKHGIWGPGSQLFGPVQTFYHAGHESVTRRNRRELCILESALLRNTPRVQIEHYVFAYRQERPKVTQPLNWHLSAADKQEIQHNLEGRYFGPEGKLDPNQAKLSTTELEEGIFSRFIALISPPRADANKFDKREKTADPFLVPGPCQVEDNQ